MCLQVIATLVVQISAANYRFNFPSTNLTTLTQGSHLINLFWSLPSFRLRTNIPKGKQRVSSSPLSDHYRQVLMYINNCRLSHPDSKQLTSKKTCLRITYLKLWYFNTFRLFQRGELPLRHSPQTVLQRFHPRLSQSVHFSLPSSPLQRHLPLLHFPSERPVSAPGCCCQEQGLHARLQAPSLHAPGGVTCDPCLITGPQR